MGKILIILFIFGTVFGASGSTQAFGSRERWSDASVCWDSFSRRWVNCGVVVFSDPRFQVAPRAFIPRGDPTPIGFDFRGPNRFMNIHSPADFYGHRGVVITH